MRTRYLVPASGGSARFWSSGAAGILGFPAQFRRRSAGDVRIGRARDPDQDRQTLRQDLAPRTGGPRAGRQDGLALRRLGTTVPIEGRRQYQFLPEVSQCALSLVRAAPPLCG